MSFISGLFGGSGGQTQTQNSNSTTNVNYAPWYENYTQDLLQRGSDLSRQPFQPYDISKMYAPFQPAQNQAFDQVVNNQTAHWPYMNAATDALNSVSGINPAQAGAPFINQAASMPNGMQAGMPWLAAGTQTWNPQVQQNYSNPFFTGSVDFANQLATQNFLERTIPGVNAQFVKSGGGLGGKNYADYMGRTVRDFTNNMMGQNQTAMAGNYWQGANQFNQDQNRYLNAGQNAGALANNTMGAYGNLGQQAAGIANTGMGAGINLANAYSGLGGALSNLNLTNTNALLQMGNQQQQNAQLPLTAGYQQYQLGQQWPYQNLMFLNQLQQGLRIPQTQTSQSSQTQNTSANSSPSILGGILGTAGAILGLPGVSDWAGGMLGGLFGGGVNPVSPSQTTGSLSGTSYNPAGGNYQVNTGIPGWTGTGNKRGGAIRGYADGGQVAGSPTGGWLSGLNGFLGSGGFQGLQGVGGPLSYDARRPWSPTTQADDFIPRDPQTGAPTQAGGSGMRPPDGMSLNPGASIPGTGTGNSGSEFAGSQPRYGGWGRPSFMGGYGGYGGYGGMGMSPFMGGYGGYGGYGGGWGRTPATGMAFLGGRQGFGPAVNNKRGGHIRREAKKYSAGGTVPVIGAMNRRAEPALRSLAAKQRPPVPMPMPSSGALSREAAPFVRGALSAAR